MIRTAHHAFEFLLNHPKLNTHILKSITAEEAEQMASDGYDIIQDPAGNHYWKSRHEILRGVQDCNKVLYVRANRETKCQILITPLAYDFDRNEKKFVMRKYLDIDSLMSEGRTYDDALVSLAKLVRKKFGDYPEPEEHIPHKCIECVDAGVAPRRPVCIQ